MIKFIKKYYIQVFTVILFGIIIVIMLVQSFGMIQKIKDKSAEFKQMQLDYALVESLLNNIYSFRQDVEYINENEDWMHVLLPNNDNEKVTLFSSLEKLAKETGNNNISLSIGAVEAVKAKTKAEKAKEGEDAKEVPITNESIKINITLTGNYNDLILFLQRIENMQYFSSVSAVNIEKTAASVKNKEAEDVTARDDLLKTTMSVVFFMDNK